MTSRGTWWLWRVWILHWCSAFLLTRLGTRKVHVRGRAEHPSSVDVDDVVMFVYCLSSVVSSLTLRSDLCDTWGWGRRRQTRQALGSSSSLIELIWCFRSLAVLAASICIRTQISAHRRYRHDQACIHLSVRTNRIYEVWCFSNLLKAFLVPMPI